MNKTWVLWEAKSHKGREARDETIRWEQIEAALGMVCT